MKNKLASILSVTLGLSAGAAASFADDASAHSLVRGKYLVERVIGCADCHSPRGPHGEFIASAWLGGAPLAFAPTVPMPAWAAQAPAIAGLPSMTDEQAVQFLMTGLRPDGTAARPPMPQFRLEEADARVVVAYLRSLPKVAATAQ